MSELMKPCLFCASPAVMKVQKHVPKGFEYTPTCTVKSCAGRLSKKWLSEKDAVEAWNRRA